MADEDLERRAQEMMKLITEREEELYGKCECNEQAEGFCDACMRKEARKKGGIRIW